MHARVTIFEGDPDKIEHGLRHWREEVQADQEIHPGFKGVVSLHDRQNRHNGRTISISFWESEEHMHARGKIITELSARWLRPRAES